MVNDAAKAIIKIIEAMKIQYLPISKANKR